MICLSLELNCGRWGHTLFKARNPEMFLELVDFFSCKRFQRICHCLPTYAYERKNKDWCCHSNVPYLCFNKCPLRNRSGNQHKNVFVPYEVWLGLFVPYLLLIGKLLNNLFLSLIFLSVHVCLKSHTCSKYPDKSSHFILQWEAVFACFTCFSETREVLKGLNQRNVTFLHVQFIDLSCFS